jgi:hypothetical protein
MINQKKELPLAAMFFNGFGDGIRFSPRAKGNVSSYHHLASVVHRLLSIVCRPPSITFSHCNLLVNEII